MNMSQTDIWLWERSNVSRIWGRATWMIPRSNPSKKAVKPRMNRRNLCSEPKLRHPPRSPDGTGSTRGRVTREGSHRARFVPAGNR